MAEGTYEEGLAEGRIQAVEKIVEDRGVNCGRIMEGLKEDLTNMGESIRLSFSETVEAMKIDIQNDVQEVVKELRGNGQPGLVKRFERYMMMAKLNWALTSAVVLTILAMALNIWGAAV